MKVFQAVYALILTFAVFASIPLVPIMQYSLRGRGANWVAVPIAVMAYIPGILLLWLMLHAATSNIPFGSRWKYLYYLEGSQGYYWLAWVCGSSAFYLALEQGFELMCRPGEQEKKRELVSGALIGAAFAATVILMFLVAACLNSYKSLAKAVSNDDIELARKRLFFNIEGVDPNNGMVFDSGSGNLKTYPLLPLAVKNGNRKMVDLLLEHGAQINPARWDGAMLLPSGLFIRNTLYFAIKNEDLSMIDYLIGKGADPSQGLLPVLEFNKVEILRHLLDKGARLDALNEFGYTPRDGEARLNAMLKEIGRAD